jgi:hypothetical protein
MRQQQVSHVTHTCSTGTPCGWCAAEARYLMTLPLSETDDILHHRTAFPSLMALHDCKQITTIIYSLKKLNLNTK